MNALFFRFFLWIRVILGGSLTTIFKDFVIPAIDLVTAIKQSLQPDIDISTLLTQIFGSDVNVDTKLALIVQAIRDMDIARSCLSNDTDLAIVQSFTTWLSKQPAEIRDGIYHRLSSKILMNTVDKPITNNQADYLTQTGFTLLKAHKI